MLPLHALAARRHRPLDRQAFSTLRRAGHRGDAQGALPALRRCGAARSASWWTRRSSASRSGTGFALVENIDYLRRLGEARFLALGRARLRHGDAARDDDRDRRDRGEVAGRSVPRARLARDRAGLDRRHRAALALQPRAGVAAAGRGDAACSCCRSSCSSSSAGASARRASGSATASTSTSSCSASCARCTSATRGSAATCNELTSRFPGPVVADMFCLLQLELELVDSRQGHADGA